MNKKLCEITIKEPYFIIGTKLVMFIREILNNKIGKDKVKYQLEIAGDKLSFAFEVNGSEEYSKALDLVKLYGGILLAKEPLNKLFDEASEIMKLKQLLDMSALEVRIICDLNDESPLNSDIELTELHKSIGQSLVC